MSLLTRKWIILPTIWPYKEGWGVCTRTHPRTILETGLTKEQAQAIADELNGIKQEIPA